MKNLPYLIILLLLGIILFLSVDCKDKKQESITNIDTVRTYIHVTDTIPGEIKYITTKIDTSIWIKKTENIPDTSYSGLLSQYKNLGNNHFSTNIFKTTFKIAEYGNLIITDTIRENRLVGSELTTDFTIPIETVTIQKEATPKRHLYIGSMISTRNIRSISGVNAGVLIRTKKDILYGVSMGYNIKPQYTLSLYYKIR